MMPPLCAPALSLLWCSQLCCSQLWPPALGNCHLRYLSQQGTLGVRNPIVHCLPSMPSIMPDPAQHISLAVRG